MKALCLLFVAVLAVGCHGCSDGWLDINGVCFYFHQDQSMPWEDAKRFCETSGAVLAKVANAQTLREFYEYILTYGLSGSYWLGASDQSYEGDWLWVADNSRVNKGTPYWAIHNGIFGWAHEPAGGADENCLLLDETRKYYFNDANCNLIHHPICMV
ncbi:perlucin-like protein [Penaeus vannamei]|uniref:C-type lectin 4 n=2 Tax=Penaeus vannamei TaxID=6689 RepID=A0A423TT90_PENVA|nr:perlucin-like protein [Penaeus vannamei]ROT79630.1 C-type lectin 4 [Penaeus vannamei]